MTNGAAPQSPQLIDLAPPAITPNAPQSLAFEPTGQDDLSPCNVDAYPADRFILLSAFAPTPITIINAAEAQNLQALLSDLQAARISPRGVTQVAIPAWAASLPPDFGILYLDQLRIRPAGTVIGEHVYTLALGPLEKVTLTQTTYTKKIVSVDSLTDSTQETDQEYSSSFSNELASTVQNEVQSQSQQKLSVDGKVGFGPVSLSAGYSSSTSQGSRNTQSQSTKQSQQITQKVSTKAKMEHRIEFKTETETGVEDIAQRVFQNPNTAHTLMLNFYKVLQRYEVYLERYGATMCWAPCLIDPGRQFRQPWIDNIAQKVAALVAVPTWVPDGLASPPGPLSCSSDWVDVPFMSWIYNVTDNQVDVIVGGSHGVVGLNVGNQITIPPGYEFDPSRRYQGPIPNNPFLVSYQYEKNAPFLCEMDTNYSDWGTDWPNGTAWALRYPAQPRARIKTVTEKGTLRCSLMAAQSLAPRGNGRERERVSQVEIWLGAMCQGTSP
jgi:hypothetical protein